MNIERMTLDNGLRVVLNEDHAAPLVAVNLWYHVGSKNEVRGRTGFAHLFEHMLFSGSEHVGNNEHFRYVQAVGGVLNGTTFFDRTNYYETLPSNHLELALWLESDRMGYFLPALTQEKLDIQKNVVQEERRLRYDNAPYGTWFEDLLALAYEDDYPYHWPTIGSMEDIGAASLDDVREFFKAYYHPGNAVLSVVGDFDLSEAKDFVSSYFGPIARGPVVAPVSSARVPANDEHRTVVRSHVQLPRVFRLYHLPRMGEPDWYAADLLGNLLATGKTSRLEKTLVYERKVAQDVSAFVLPTELSGMLIVAITAKDGVSADAIEEELDLEIDQFVAEGPDRDELQRVKNQTETDYAHQIEQVESRADLFGMYTTFFDEPERIDTWLDAYRDIGAETIRDVAARALEARNRVTVQFVPISEGDPGTGVA